MTVSLRVMHAGDGYRYLLKSVAAGDGDRDLASPLTRYYAEQGSPPGRWHGGGLKPLGLADGQQVAEQHLELLLGHGLHPLTADPLGRAYPRYPTAAERIARRVAALDPALPPDQTAAAVRQIETEEQAKPSRHACAGYDLTFSVPKSVSVLWGLADAGTQQIIADAHHQAVAHVLDLFEREVATTRTGATKRASAADSGGAVVQADVTGIAAAWFDHCDSRAADPQLHTHAVVAAKTMTAQDGRWRVLDGRPIHHSLVALSAHYNAVLADTLTRRLGVAWEQRPRGRDRNPAWEISGVPETLIAEFSSRADDIDTATAQLIDQYQAKHHRRPSQRVILRLRQQATLATRPDKQVRSLADLTVEWRRRAIRHLDTDPTRWAAGLVDDSPPGPLLRADDIPLDLIAQVGQQVMAAVGDKRATWRRWNLFAEAARQTMGWRFATACDREAVTQMITDAAQQASLRLTPAEPVTPADLRRDDGTSRLRPKDSALFTSEALYAAEERLLALSRHTGAPTIDLAAVQATAAQPDEDGVVLGDDQAEALEAIAVSGLTVDLLVGPAGAGKTTALNALKQAWEQRHGPEAVVGLAPSATAAAVLAEDLGVPCENTAKWLADHDHQGLTFRAGQLVILDEASLCGTFTLDRIAAQAAQAGAKLLLVGDWAQLQAVEAGGAFGLLAAERGNPPELADIHRFHADWEKNASLALRFGHLEAIDAYADHGRIREGDADHMRHAAYAAWKTDLDQGLASVLIADDNQTVADLNRQARHDRILQGHVNPESEITLADGTRASEGDLVITRRNDRRLTAGKTGWVRNGDRWIITRVHDDGSVTVRRAGHRRGASTVLPAPYTADHLDLGYAITAHRAQGITVDTSHVVTTDTTTRETFYVAMTRGRTANTCYVATDHPAADTDTLTLGRPRTARDVLADVLRRPSAEQSAHQAAQAERDRWESIAQLAAEHETIRRATQEPLLVPPKGMTAIPSRRLILGLIPAASKHVQPEFKTALDDCERRLIARADHLVRQAIRDNEPWLTALADRPGPGHRQPGSRWWETARTIAAYRELCNVTSDNPIGPRPANPKLAVIRERAKATLVPFTGNVPAQPVQWHAPTPDHRPPASRL